MHILFLIVCIVNSFLIKHCTTLGFSDAVWWLWTMLPGIAYIIGGTVDRKD